MVLVVAKSQWLGCGDVVVAVQIEGGQVGIRVLFSSPNQGIPSRLPALSPASRLTGRVDGSGCGSSGLAWIFVWPAKAMQLAVDFGKVVMPQMGGVVGASLRVLMQDVGGVAFPVSCSIVWGGRLGFGYVEIFRSECSIVACGIVLPPGQWSLWVELFPLSFVVVSCFLPVLVRLWTAYFGGWMLMEAVCLGFGLFFFMLFQLICVVYFCYVRRINHCSLYCFWHAMSTNQLGWVCVDGGGPAMEVLVVNWC